MSKPYFAYENLVSDATVSARTENPVYPASKLTKHRLWPGYRSDDQSLVLNGTDEYTYAEDHADFNISGDLTIEFVISPDVLSGLRAIISKRVTADGYAVFQSIDEIALQLRTAGNLMTVKTTGNVLSVGGWARVKVVYDSSNQEVTIYVNGIEAGHATNSLQTGCTLVGVVPSSIGITARAMGVGAETGPNYQFQGKIAYVGIAPAAYDHGGYLDPAICAGYWNFDGDLSDSSGNGHTLTGVNIDTSNYQNCTAYQWTLFDFGGASVAPDFLFIDRRHNFSSSAILRLLQRNPYEVYDYSTQPPIPYFSAIPAPGMPVVGELYNPTSTSSSKWWLEIHDPDNPDGYIEIPYIYLGSRVELGRGFLRGYRHTERRHGTMLSNSVGGYTAYARSEELWEADFRLRALPGDLATVQSLAAVAGLSRPFVFSEDGSIFKTRLVYWPDAMAPSYTHNVGDQNFVDLPLREAGGGL